MASTFAVAKYTGTAPGTRNAGMNYLHLINQDTVANGATDYQSVAANQITVPTSGNVYSYECWFRGEWTGTYNEITAFKIWRSAGPTNGSNGLTWKIGTVVQASYTTPVNTASAVATDSTFESEGAAVSVAVTGASPNTVSDLMCLQLTVASTAGPGDVGETTYSLKWTES